MIYKDKFCNCKYIVGEEFSKYRTYKICSTHIMCDRCKKVSSHASFDQTDRYINVNNIIIDVLSTLKCLKASSKKGK